MKDRFRSNFAKILATSFLFTIFFNNINLSTVDAVAEKAGDVMLQSNTQGDSDILQNSSGSAVNSIEYAHEGAESAGIKDLSGTYVLDTKYKEPNKFVIYYGELVSSGISDYSVYDFMVVHDRNYESIHKARSQGCSIFQYLSFGSRFSDTDNFIRDFKAQIIDLKNKGLADGIFIDECDVACWGAEYPNQPDKCQRFYNRLKEITDYCKANGLKTVVNGTSAFCELGDYYLWESFQGYWSTNTLLWSAAPTGRTKLANGSVTYKRPLSEWKASGSCYLDGACIRGGSNGAIEMLIDMDKVLEPADRKENYDWVYLQWTGSNVSENNCSMWLWTGDSLPFNEATWSKLPKLWKGKDKSWNGIGKTSKYIKIRMEFKGVSDLKIDSIALTYNYLYPFWDMSDTNADAKTNPFVWNYSITQRNYLWEKMKESGNKIKVLTHTYGSEDDSNRKMFSKLSSEIWGYHAFDYVNPSMQNIYDTDELDNPIGMLLKREGDNTGYFTGATASIDISSQKYSLTRSEPDYWYKRVVIVDGIDDDWSSDNILYQNNQKALSFNTQTWSACTQTFSQGLFDNIKVVTKADGGSVLELVKDGTGIWISPVISSGENNPISKMEQIMWNGDGEGSISYSVKYKSIAGEWSDWLEVSKDSTVSSNDFVEFQLKVVLSGKASYYENNMKRDKYGNTVSDNDLFHQGISFWGSSHRWKAYLSDNIKVNKLSVTDDSKYIYFSFAVDGAIDFSGSSGVESGNLYEIYLNTSGIDEKGFTGNWWNLPFGADYKISNGSIYKWNDSYSKKDFKGWMWIGSSRMTYKLSKDRKFIEYRVAKDSLGGLEAKSVKISMYVEEVKTKAWNFIKPIESGNSTIKEYFSYNQKSYKQNTPHGWFRSDEINVYNKKDVGITWEQNIPSGTSLKAWIRTKQKNNDWGDWQEVTNGKLIQGNYEKMQYCFGLYTNNGGVTPSVKNIRYVFGSTIY